MKMYNLAFYVFDGDEVHVHQISELRSHKEMKIQRKRKLKELKEDFKRRDILVDEQEFEVKDQAA